MSTSISRSPTTSIVSKKKNNYSIPYCNLKIDTVILHSCYNFCFYAEFVEILYLLCYSVNIEKGAAPENRPQFVIVTTGVLPAAD